MVEGKEHMIPVVGIAGVLVELSLHDEVSPGFQQPGYILDAIKVHIRPAAAIA